LQTNPRQDLAAFHAHERERLSTYAWVDRDKGVIRIPIERAIALLAERGLPGSASDGRGAGAGATPNARDGAVERPIQRRTRARARLHTGAGSAPGARPNTDATPIRQRTRKRGRVHVPPPSDGGGR
jgi:hypothetical protein